MNIKNIFLSLAFLLTSQIISAQEESNFRFDTYLFLGIGSAEIVNNDQPNYVMDSRYTEFLLNFKFGEKFGAGTGIGFIQLRGNGFDPSGNFFHQRSMLKVPLLITIIEPINDYFEVYGNGGLFWYNVIKDEFQYLTNTVNDVYDGSGLGAQVEFGITINVPRSSLSLFDTKVGIFVSGQAFGDFDATDSNLTQEISEDYVNYGLILSSTF